MSDRDWREAERAWQADPQDGARYEAALAARRRAGIPISGPLLENLIHPPCTFASSEGFAVYTLSPERTLSQIGTTPGSVEIPRHRGWVIHAGPDQTQAGLSEARARRVPGLFLTRPFGELPALEGLGGLEWLGLDGEQDPVRLRSLPQSLVRLWLGWSFKVRSDWSHSLPRLPHLTELWVLGTPLDPVTLVGLARLPNLRRLHVDNPTRHLRSFVHETLPHCRLASA